LPQHREKAFAKWRENAYELSKELTFDVVHVHDFNALELGYRLHIERKVKFVYDSHEWWLGRQRQYRPTPLIDRREAELEKLWGSQASAVITVGNSIADLFRNERGFKNVHVVRNSFPLGERATITSPPKGALYAGRIDAYRELETIIGAARELPIKVLWMGEHLNAWATKNLPHAKDAGIEIQDAKTISEVTKQMQSLGLALVTHSNRFVSHRLAMPNKLFHAVHAGVPIIATDVSELAAIVKKYDLGELYEPGNVKSFVTAVNRAIARHGELINNVAAAQSALSWPRDETTLLEIYAKL
jgi:glycosyltransferase involved in cell wall biosynthesis